MDLDPTFYSSFFYLSNCLVAYYYDYILYSALFFGLFSASLLWRLNESIHTFILDKLFIISVVGYGGYLFTNRCYEMNGYVASIIVSTFLATGFLFYGGYITNQYCYDKDEKKGKLYHCLLHGISSVGHHLIVLA
jgi:hypothetical protein